MALTRPLRLLRTCRLPRIAVAAAAHFLRRGRMAPVNTRLPCARPQMMRHAVARNVAVVATTVAATMLPTTAPSAAQIAALLAPAVLQCQ